MVDAKVKAALVAGMKARDAWFCSAEARAKLGALVVRGARSTRRSVGLYPRQIAGDGRLRTSATRRRCFVSGRRACGWDHPLSIEKLSPILAVLHGEGLEGGLRALHRDPRLRRARPHAHDPLAQRGESSGSSRSRSRRTASSVNTPASHGAIGLSTWLDPSLTLGCGAFGGNITSDNITAQHLLLTKRLAFGKPGFRRGGARCAESRDEVGSAPLAKRPAPPRSTARRPPSRASSGRRRRAGAEHRHDPSH